MNSSLSPSLPRLLLSAALDYLRWTQLIPMITAWGGLLLFFGIPFVVWCVSAWSLTISWAIGRVQDRLAVDASMSG